jgi:hypothetical protein
VKRMHRTALSIVAMIVAMVVMAGGRVLLHDALLHDASAAPAAAPGANVPSPAAIQNDLERVAPPSGPPLDQERDLGRGPRPLEPIFLEPAAATTKGVRLGLSSWIAPGAPFDHRENPGGVAIGFTIARPTLPAASPAPGP